MNRGDNLRAWRAANPEAVKTHNRANYARHRAKIQQATKLWREANPDKAKKYREKQKQKPGFKEKRRAQALQRKYGISLAGYTLLLEQQAGKCALCSRTESSTKYGVLVVDHDHKTGKVRGLLCDPCNHALGILGDNSEGITKALQYVSGDVS